MIRDSYPFTGIDPGLISVRDKVHGLFFKIKSTSAQGRVGPQAHKQFSVSRTLFTYPQKRFLDFEPLVWDKVILIINKRIKYANSKRIRRKIYRAWQQAQSFRTEAQEPARLRLWDDPAAARARRPVGQGAGMQRQLARSAKLRHLYAIAAGPDGRRASSGGWRNGYHYSDQGTKIHGSQEVQGQRQSIQIINRGLRAPTPHQKSYPQARAKIKSYPQGTGTSSGTSWDSSSAQGTGRVGPQARKPSVTSSRIAEPGKSIGSL